MTQWLRLHAQALVEALRRIAAQPVASAISIVVLGVALALPLTAAVLLRSASAAAASLDTDPHVNVYLSLDAGDEDARRIERALRASPVAASVRFVSKTQALEELRTTTHLAEVLASLDRNPLPHAFTVRVRAAEPAAIQAARAEWAQLGKDDQVVADFDWSQRLGRWMRLGERVLAGLGGLLALAVLFIVGHLIRLQVLMQREEIEVSQLIGATAADVRRRFVYHGALQGLLAGVTAVLLTLAISFALGREMQALAPTYVSDFKIDMFRVETVLAVIAAAAALGLFGAWLAVDRELRAFARDR